MRLVWLMLMLLLLLTECAEAIGALSSSVGQSLADWPVRSAWATLK